MSRKLSNQHETSHRSHPRSVLSVSESDESAIERMVEQDIETLDQIRLHREARAILPARHSSQNSSLHALQTDRLTDSRNYLP